MSEPDPNSLAEDVAPLIVIGGPTASGKSPLALSLAQTCAGTIINADSMQVYRELRVLTARPSAADEVRVMHHLYGFLSAAQRYSVGLWLGEARRIARACLAAGGVPLVVGGSGFYLDAMVRGLSPIPDIPDEIRTEVARRAKASSPAELHAMAMACDPDLARRLPPGDTRRLMRLIEVAEATGEPLSSWQTLPRQDGWKGPVLYLIVEPDRPDLYAACDARFDAMVADGALDEVRELADLGLSPDLPAMRALGVPHLLAHLRGGESLAGAVAASKTATRHFAKRQLTWFRHQAPQAVRLTAARPADRLEMARSHVSQFLLTGKGPKA